METIHDLMTFPSEDDLKNDIDMTPQDIVLFLKLKAGYAVEAGLDEQVTCA